MSVRVDPALSVPPSRQIVEALLDAIARGALVPGTKLLSVRRLAGEALVNPNTAAKAYRDLTTLGALRTRNGLGVFVTEAAPSIARKLRARATLEAFERAASEALRAGHDIAGLLDLLREAATAAGESS